jgi:hypothetical protein
MATFVTDAALRTQVTAQNAMLAEPLPGHWDAILPRANVTAYTRLRAAVFDRGMTAAEFAQFGNGETTDGYDWNLRLGVLFAFLAATRADPEQSAAFRDEIKAELEELATAALVIDDEVWAPAPGNARISRGDQSTSVDRFTLDDPDGDFYILIEART